MHHRVSRHFRRAHHSHHAVIVGVLALVRLGFGATEGGGMRSVMDAAAISVARSPLHVVGLGDSVPAGSACNCSDFVQLAAATLARERGRLPQVVAAVDR